MSVSRRSGSARGRQVPLRRPSLTLETVVDSEGWTSPALPAPNRTAAAVARALARTVALPSLKVSATLVLADDARVRTLNKAWRGLDKPTNVLSFPAAPDPCPAAARSRPASVFLGDVILARETLEREATRDGISLSNHFHHLVLHGLLHLLGYDHETDEEAGVMEALETCILATLGIADPYGGDDPVPPAAMHRRRAGGA